jgi:hypothetical protein
MYVLLKLYILVWRSVEYSPFFITMTIFTMCAVFSGVVISLRYRLVATALFLVVMFVDLSVVLGATEAVKFLSNYSLQAQPITRRHLLFTEDDGQPGVAAQALVEAFGGFTASAGRLALSNAALALGAYVNHAALSTVSAEAASQIVADAKGMFQSFMLGLRTTVDDLVAGSATLGNANAADLNAHANALLTHADALFYVLQETHCCDPNTRFDLIIARLYAQVHEYDAAFDAELEEKTGGMRVAAQAIERSLATTPQVENKQVRSWVKAVQSLLVRGWKAVVGKANAIKINRDDLPNKGDLPNNGDLPDTSGLNSPFQKTTSPWLNVPDFIRVVWVTVHCLCAAVNLVLTTSLWSRDFTWNSLFGANPHKKFDTVGAGMREDVTTVAANTRYASSQLSKRPSKQPHASSPQQLQLQQHIEYHVTV